MCSERKNLHSSLNHTKPVPLPISSDWWLLPLDEEGGEAIRLTKAPPPHPPPKNKARGMEVTVFLNLDPLNPLAITIRHIMSQGICRP